MWDSLQLRNGRRSLDIELISSLEGHVWKPYLTHHVFQLQTLLVSVPLPAAKKQVWKPLYGLQRYLLVCLDMLLRRICHMTGRPTEASSRLQTPIQLRIVANNCQAWGIQFQPLRLISSSGRLFRSPGRGIESQAKCPRCEKSRLKSSQ